MSPDKFCPITNRIEVWSRCAVFAFALASVPLLPAYADQDGRDRDDDRRGSETTTVSVPLTGTGVEPNGAPTGSSSPTGNAGTKAGGDKDDGGTAKSNEGAKQDGRQEGK